MKACAMSPTAISYRLKLQFMKAHESPSTLMGAQ